MSISRVGFARRRLRAFMPHRYVRIGQTPRTDSGLTPGVDESEDEIGQQAYGTPPPPKPGQRCRWMPTPLQGTIGGQRTGQYVTVSFDGTRIVQAPVMLVPPDDPIVAGDTISNVTATDPETQLVTLLFAGPAVVSNVMAASAGDTGAAICKRVYIRSAQEVV